MQRLLSASGVSAAQRQVRRVLPPVGPGLLPSVAARPRARLVSWCLLAACGVALLSRDHRELSGSREQRPGSGTPSSVWKQQPGYGIFHSSLPVPSAEEVCG